MEVLKLDEWADNDQDFAVNMNGNMFCNDSRFGELRALQNTSV